MLHEFVQTNNCDIDIMRRKKSIIFSILKKVRWIDNFLFFFFFQGSGKPGLPQHRASASHHVPAHRPRLSVWLPDRERRLQDQGNPWSDRSVDPGGQRDVTQLHRESRHHQREQWRHHAMCLSHLSSYVRGRWNYTKNLVPSTPSCNTIISDSK